MAIAVPVQKANDQAVDGLLSALRWSQPDLTYSFPTHASFYGPNYGYGEPQNNFAPLNALQIAAARAAFGMIAAVTNLTFTEIDETEAVHADLRLALSDTPVPAWTYTLDEGGAEGGDTWYNHSGGWYAAPVRGNYAFWCFLHEIGHALGLKHGHEDGGFGATTFALDTMENSVMTYRSYVGSAGQTTTNEAWG